MESLEKLRQEACLLEHKAFAIRDLIKNEDVRSWCWDIDHMKLKKESGDFFAKSRAFFSFYEKEMKMMLNLKAISIIRNAGLQFGDIVFVNFSDGANRYYWTGHDLDYNSTSSPERKPFKFKCYLSFTEILKNGNPSKKVNSIRLNIDAINIVTIKEKRTKKINDVIRKYIKQ